MPPIVSTRKGIEATWSRCECVTKMWSICESSASVRSPTPVPASIRMSLSARNEVVRRWRPPIPPEHPSTLKRMARPLPYFSSNAVTPSQPLGEHAVQAACRIHAQQVDHVELGLIPPLSAVGAQGRIPQSQLVAHILA